MQIISVLIQYDAYTIIPYSPECNGCSSKWLTKLPYIYVHVVCTGKGILHKSSHKWDFVCLYFFKNKNICIVVLKYHLYFMLFYYQPWLYTMTSIYFSNLKSCNFGTKIMLSNIWKLFPVSIIQICIALYII